MLLKSELHLFHGIMLISTAGTPGGLPLEVHVHGGRGGEEEEREEDRLRHGDNTFVYLR
jgi:hypothetical protein